MKKGLGSLSSLPTQDLTSMYKLWPLSEDGVEVTMREVLSAEQSREVLPGATYTPEGETVDRREVRDVRC